MKLYDLPDENELLKRILLSGTESSSSSPLDLPNGDDAAVYHGSNSRWAWSTDTFVARVHFHSDYFSPYQVGCKVIEGSVSDLVAVGAYPRYVLIGLTLPNETEVTYVEELYRGIRKASGRVGVQVIGGDITSAPFDTVITVTAGGEIPCDRLPITRSGARRGDLIYLSGPLGGSHAGLRVLCAGKPGFPEVKEKHLSPRCRVDLIEPVGRIATSLIDISDGLSSELWHLSEMSNCGILIEEASIPIGLETREVASLFGEDPLSYVYGGGEDYELLFTASRGADIPEGCIQIGEVDTEQGVRVKRPTGLDPLERRGYDHLRTVVTS